MIAFSILVLLLTLSSQINRICEVVGAMNTHFSSVSLRMDEISDTIGSMEIQVAQMRSIEEDMATMQVEIEAIGDSYREYGGQCGECRSQHVHGTRMSVENIAGTMHADEPWRCRP